MGLGKFLKKVLHIGGSGGEQTQEQEKEQEQTEEQKGPEGSGDDTISGEQDTETLSTPSTEGGEIQKVEEEVGQESVQTSGSELQELGQQLGTLKKGRFRSTNSAKYEAVRSAVTEVNTATTQSFSGDRSADQKMAMDMLTKYGKLQSACEAYLAKASDRFASGRARKETVSAILALAQKDIPGIRSAVDRIPTMAEGEITSYTWKDVIADARTRHIQLKGTMGGLKTLGGAVSTVKQIKTSDTTGGGSGGFFKAHESSTRYSEADSVDNDVAATIWPIVKQAALQMHPLSEQGMAAIKDMKHPTEITNDPRYYTKELLDFAAAWDKMYDGRKELFNHMYGDWALDMGSKVGEDVSVSKRNVASSRLAELLGEGDVIAHSELAEVQEKDGGAVTSGILMQMAQGTEGRKIVDEFAGKMQKDLFEKGLDNFKVGMNEMSYDMVTPSFQKSMASLQVMDWISGQIDRHAGNYFVQQDENGKLTGVTGIDNDFSFGRTAGAGNYGMHTVEDGRLTIPHMDKNLAMRVLQLTPETIQIFLGDLIEPTLIDSCWERVKQLQDAIKAEMQDKDSKVLIDKDEDWNEQTHNDFMAQSRTKDRKVGKKANYYSDFMISSLPRLDIHVREWRTEYESKQFEEYIRVRCIDNPALFREYLVRELEMDPKAAQRLYARGLLDPLRYTYDEMPYDVRFCFGKYCQSYKAYNDKLAENARAQQQPGGEG